MIKLTQQEMFDKSYLGLASQNFLQSHRDGGCLYRGPNGRKCAIGHLIPDDKYKQKMEGDNIFARSIRSLFPVKQLSMLGDLQEAHDHPASATRRRKAFERVAKQYGLTVPEIVHSVKS